MIKSMRQLLNVKLLNVSDEAKVELTGISFVDPDTQQPVYICNDECKDREQAQTDDSKMYFYVKISK